MTIRNRTMRPLIAIFLLLHITQATWAQADLSTYLDNIKTEMQKKWPDNRTINLVFHGHSVPTGYFRTPAVHTLEAYPHRVLQELKKIYPYAVINVITTSIGGENSEQGAKRMKKDVLPHHPDVLFIDYALNDRSIGLRRSRAAMEKMIRMALKKKIKVILMTPSPDLSVDNMNPDNILNKLRQQLISLAAEYKIGVVDSYGAFLEEIRSGKALSSFMAQSNHPNQRGHQLIVQKIMPWFEVSK